MEIVTKTYEIYNADELDSQALEKAKQDYMQSELESDIRVENFIDLLKENAKGRYGLDIQPLFDLSYSQGDGLCFECSNLLTDEMIEIIKEKLECRQDKIVLNAIIESYYCYKFYSKDSNHLYYYAQASDIDNDIYTYNLWLEYANKHPHTKLTERDFENSIDNIDNILTDWYLELCNEYKKWGYEELYYEPTDDEFIEICEINEWKFLKNGKMYL